MAIGFSYTLSPDEKSSWVEFNKFADEVANKKIKVSMDFSASSSSGGKGGSPVEDWGKDITRQVELLQERLRTTLNNLTIKADKNLLDGILPTDELQESIDRLGKMDAPLSAIRLEASEIRLALQQWGQVITNNKQLLEGVENIAGNLGNKIDKASFEQMRKEVELAKKEVNEYIQTEVQAIRHSKEFQSATEAQKTAFMQLAQSLEVNAFSVQGVERQFNQFNDELEKQKKLFQDRYIDQATRGYDDLSGTIKNLVVRYVSLQAVLHNVKAYFQDAVQYAMDLDDAYTDVAISMDITRQEFSKWTKDARTIAQANGLMTTSLMEMVKIYATAEEDITDVQDKLAGTAMIQNITQWDATTTTSAVNSVINQYKLLDKEINGVSGSVSNAISYMGDALVGISNALSIDNVQGIQEMVSAIDDAGSVVESAGGSMEWYMGVTGTLAESMNASGSEIGAAMRMISARTLQQKQIIEDMGESVENFELETAQAEGALNDIGVSIRGQGGELRELEDILGDVASQWGTLSDSSKEFLGEKLAGNNRRSYFVNMMENYSRVLELQDAGLNASGALFEANEKRVESLAGQINIFKDRIMALTGELQTVMLGGVKLGNSILELVDMFGLLPTTVGLATGSFLTFSKVGRDVRDNIMTLGEAYVPALSNLNRYISGMGDLRDELQQVVQAKKASIQTTLIDIETARANNQSTAQYVTRLGEQQTALKATQLQLAKTTIKTVALQTAMSLGLSVAISGAIWAIGKLGSELKDAIPSIDNVKASMSDLNETFGEYRTSVENLENVKSSMGSMNEMLERLENENLSMEEQKELSDELNKILANHASSYESIESVLKNENIAYEDRIRLLEREAELQEQLNANKVLEELNKKDMFGLGDTGIENMSKLAEEYSETLANVAEDVNTLNERIASGDVYNGIENTLKYNSDRLGEARTNIESLSVELANFVSNVDYLKSMGRIDDAQYEAYMEQYRAIIEVLEKSAELSGIDLNLFKMGDDEEGASDAVDKVNESLERLADNSNYVASKTEIVTQALSDLKSTLGNAENMDSQTLFDSIKGSLGVLEEGTTGAKTALDSLKAVFPEMGSEVDTLAEAVDYLGTKSLLETAQSAENLNSILRDLKDEGAKALDTSTMSELLELYPELGARVGDVAYVQEFLNEKIEEMGKVTEDTYNNMLAQDSEFWNNKMKNSEEWFSHEAELQARVTELGAEMLGIQSEDFANFINEKGGFREIDYSNAINASQAEGTLNSNLLNQMIKWYAEYVNQKGGARSADMDNVIEFLNSQGVAEAQTVEQLVELWNQYYKAKKAEIQSSLSTLYDSINAGNPYGDLGNLTPEQSKQLGDLQKQYIALENSAKNMGNYFEQVNTSFQGITSNLATSTGLADKIASSLNGSSLPDKKASSSKKEKEVADLELKIDRYYALNDAIEDNTNALEENERAQNRAEGKQRLSKLYEERIKLLEKQKKAYEALRQEQLNEAQDFRNAIANAGFSMDGDGNITNYQEQLKNMVNYANSLSGDAKEAQIAYVKSISEIIDAYTTLTNSSIPNTEEAIEDLTSDMQNLNKEHEEAIKYLNDLKDAYYNLNKAIKEVDNALDLNRAKQENATPEERVRLMEEEIALMKERQDLIKEQEEAYGNSAKDIAEQLGSQGIKFDENGKITNYDEVIDNLINVANNLVGTSQEEAQKEIEDLLDLIAEYDDIMLDTLPDLSKEWEEYATAIKEAEKAKAELVTSVEKDISSAIENEYTKRYNLMKKYIQKEKDLLNEQYEQEDHENTLAKKNRELDELQKAIDDLSRDQSDAGQMKLRDLMEQYKQKQEELNEYIRDYEKEQGNNRFDEEMDKLDEELEEILSPENLADMVNKALVDGFVTIGEEVIELNTLMSDWLNETGDGLYAIGDIIREEWINNLLTVKELISGMGILSASPSGFSVTNANTSDKVRSAMENSRTARAVESNISIGSLLTVEGNVTEDVLPQVETMLSSFEDKLEETMEKLAYEMSQY